MICGDNLAANDTEGSMSKTRSGLVCAAFLIVLTAWAGVCVADVSLPAPEVAVTEGDGMVKITWRDSDWEDLVLINKPQLGTSQFVWRGNADSIRAQGSYTGACDWKFDLLVAIIADTVEFSWTGISDWTTMTPESRNVQITELDHAYDIADGIQIVIGSDGLFDLNKAGWEGPDPVLGGVYTGGDPLGSEEPVTFSFTCSLGGQLGAGDSVVFAWSNSIGGSASFSVKEADSWFDIEKGFTVGFPGGGYIQGQQFSVDVYIPFVATDRLGIRAETFDGYQVLRHSFEDRPSDDPQQQIGQYKVIKEISKCDTFDFFIDPDTGLPDPDGERTYVDVGVDWRQPGVNPDPDFSTVTNGFAYDYAVVTYDWTSTEEQAISDTIHWHQVVPSASPASSASAVSVIPNPFIREAFGGKPQVQFVNLPLGSVIRIYDATGGFVRTVYPEDYSYGGQQGRAEWDLRNGDGDEITSGIYIYRVESAGGSKTGRFIVVR